MGISTTADDTPLLKNADQNIGNSTVLLPQAGTSGTLIPQATPGQSPRVIDLKGGSAVGQTTTIVLTASRIIGGTTDNPNPGLPGPVTAVIEFGNGGRSTVAEVDVPFGPFAGTFAAATSAIQPQDGGTIITVPTSVVRVFARYDNLLITPRLSGIPVSLAQVAGVPFVGPGGPIGGAPAEPLLVKAMAAYFTRSRSRAYKTLYLYVSQMAPTPIAVPRSFFCLPAFTKSVKIQRLPLSSALTVELSNGSLITDQVAVAAGSSAPEIEIVGHVNTIGISSTAPADTVTFLALVCEIGI